VSHTIINFDEIVIILVEVSSFATLK